MNQNIARQSMRYNINLNSFKEESHGLLKTVIIVANHNKQA